SLRRFVPGSVPSSGRRLRQLVELARSGTGTAEGQHRAVGRGQRLPHRLRVLRCDGAAHHRQVNIAKAGGPGGLTYFFTRRLVTGLAVRPVVNDGAEAERGDLRKVLRRDLAGHGEVGT